MKLQRNILFGVLAIIAFGGATAHAANQFYFGGFGRISDCCTTFNAGGGGEFLIGGSFGVGGALSFLGPTSDLGEGFGALDVSGSYHFQRIPSKWDPFVMGGYTLFFRSGTANLFHVGGGFHYWTGSRYGVRVQIIDRIYSDFGTTHYYSFLAGFAIR